MPERIKIGYRVGKLTVSAPTQRRKNGYMVWDCLCDCGNRIQLDTRCLQRQTIKDCGCETNVSPGQSDITGQRFGKLIALEPTGMRSKSGSVIWRCQCDCGNTVESPLSQLRAGYRKSCGCLSHPPLKDWIGKRFGRLTVTEYKYKKKGMHYWKCKCDCGNEAIVGQSLLLEGKTKSCGCLQKEVVHNNLKLVDGTSVTLLEHGSGKLASNNTSGYTGVYFHKRSGRWVASIRFKGKYYHLGSFDNKNDAVKARQRGEKLHENFIKWYYSEHPEKLEGKEKGAETDLNSDKNAAVKGPKG